MLKLFHEISGSERLAAAGGSLTAGGKGGQNEVRESILDYSQIFSLCVVSLCFSTNAKKFSGPKTPQKNRKAAKGVNANPEAVMQAAFELYKKCSTNPDEVRYLNSWLIICVFS